MPKQRYVPPQELTEAVGRRLALARERRGLTQREVADQIPQDSQNLSKTERGEQMPGAGALARLCEILECSADWVLFERGDPPLNKDQREIEKRHAATAEQVVREYLASPRGTSVSELVATRLLDPKREVFRALNIGAPSWEDVDLVRTILDRWVGRISSTVSRDKPPSTTRMTLTDATPPVSKKRA